MSAFFDMIFDQEKKKNHVKKKKYLIVERKSILSQIIMIVIFLMSIGKIRVPFLAFSKRLVIILIDWMEICTLECRGLFVDGIVS